MIIDIKELLLGRSNTIDIDETISFELDKTKEKNIKELKDINVQVHIYKDDINDIYFDISMNGVMILTCARTNKAVNYPFEVNYSTSLEEIYENFYIDNKRTTDKINITPSLLEAIMLEVPLRVLSDEIKDENIYGDGWKLVVTKEEQTIDPRLEKLKDLLK